MDMHSRKERNLFLKRQDGVVALEFVILFPLFLLIVAGIVEFGHLFYVRHTLTNATREGARAAVVYFSTDRVSKATNAANNAVDKYLNPPDGKFGGAKPTSSSLFPTAAIEMEISGLGATSGTTSDPFTVTITASDVMLVLDKLIADYLDQPITVTAATTMRLE